MSYPLKLYFWTRASIPSPCGDGALDQHQPIKRRRILGTGEQQRLFGNEFLNLTTVSEVEDKGTIKGIVHFEIKFWYVLAYLKGIQDVGVFFPQ